MRRPEKGEKKRSPRREAGPADKLAPRNSHFESAPSNQLLHDLFGDLDVGFASVTQAGQILYSNSKFALTSGAPPHRALAGVNLHNLVSPHSWEALDAALRQANHQFVVGEIKLDAFLDKPQTIRLSLSPARLMDQPVIRIVADEVTELVEANIQLRETEASLRSLSGRILQIQDQERRKMARDLHDTTGQELAVLVMSLRHLADSLDRPGVDVQKAIVDAAELAQKVNDEIRTFSYMLHPPLLDQLGLASALRWYVDGFSSRTNIEVRLIMPQDLQRISAEKETALFRVVQEGLTNVLRHSSSKKAKIVVSASIDEVELTVRDEGTGLAPAVVDRLASGAGSRGMGVGIPGLRERLHQLGGKLQISGGHAGTTLKAILPLEQAEARLPLTLPEVAAGNGDEAVAAHQNGRKRVLIVDDHELMRRGIRALLEMQTDLEICGEAGDGSEAVRKTRELQPDLIILDLNMPGSGGLSAAHQLKKYESPAKILVFTTHSFPGMEQVLRSAGCQGMVSKVHAERDLLRGIRAVLSGDEFYNASPVSSLRAHTG